MTEQTNSLTPEEMLAQLNDNESVAFKLFDEKVARHAAHAVYCFVEGYDQAYYQHVIKIFAAGEDEYIPCGGKKGVLRAFDFISSKPAYSQYRTLYFVDKDYDDNSHLSPRIFVTDGYAVENYYASDQALRRAIQTFCQITPERQAEIDAALAWYQDWKNDFLDATRLFCRWYANTVNRPDRHISKDRFRVVEGTKYKNSFPSRYATISAGGITSAGYTLAQLNSDYELASPVTAEEIDRVAPMISSLNDIRGKYVIKLVQEFLEALKNDSNRSRKYISRPFSFEKNQDTILVRLSSAADVSPRLITYLKSNL